MMWLGNIDFGTADTATVNAKGADDPIRVAEKLLGVGDLEKLLTTRAITVNGEVTFAKHSVQCLEGPLMASSDLG